MNGCGFSLSFWFLLLFLALRCLVPFSRSSSGVWSSSHPLSPGGLMNHMALVGGGLASSRLPEEPCQIDVPVTQRLLKIVIRAADCTPRQWKLSLRNAPPPHTRTGIAKVMQQSHQLCHSASAGWRPQWCLLMWSCSLSPDPFPLNTASSQPCF